MELAQDSGSSESNGSSSQGVQLEQPSIQRAKWPPLEAPVMGMSQLLSKEVDFPVRSEKKVCPAIETIDLSDPDAFKRVEGTCFNTCHCLFFGFVLTRGFKKDLTLAGSSTS